MAIRPGPSAPDRRTAETPPRGPEDVRFLQIEPTTRCNFTCGFCAGRAMEQGDLDLETFRQAVKSFPRLEHIELQGEGEPLLNPHFFEMARVAREAGARVSVITNGSLLHPTMVGRILEAGLEQVLVSIESADAEEFKAIRGGDLGKVVEGIRSLLAARDERGLDRPSVGFAVTVLRSTRSRTAGVLALYRRLGLDGGIVIQPLQGMESYTRHYGPAMVRERLSDPEIETHLIRAYTDPVMRQIVRSRSAARGFYDELLGGWRAGERRCAWLDSALSINRKGTVTPCCNVKEPTRHDLGRIGTDRPTEILARGDRLRAELAGGSIPAACTDCIFARLAVLSRTRLVGIGLRWFWKWATEGRLPAHPDQPLPPLR